MRQYTNESQTAKLIELGFEKPKNTQYVQRVKARNLHSPFIEFGEPEFEGSYSIGELLSSLPPIIPQENGYYINITHDSVSWVIDYKQHGDTQYKYIVSNVELIDAILDMIIKLKEGGII
jgi:hypothetical protein